MTPLLQDLKQKGCKINILYGIPLVPSQVPLLAKAARELGENSITVMIDHPDQLPYLEKLSSLAGHGLPPRRLTARIPQQERFTRETCLRRGNRRGKTPRIVFTQQPEL